MTDNMRDVPAARLWLGDKFSLDNGSTWHILAVNTTEHGFVECFKGIRPGYARARTYRLDLTRDQTVRVSE